MTESTEVVKIRLSKETVDEVRRLAQEEDRSLAKQFERLIKEGLKRQ